MSKAGKLILALVAVAVIAGGVLLMTSGGKKAQIVDTSNTGQSGDSSTVDATITYNGSGFSVEPSTVKAGGKVKIVNDSQQELDFASDPHPVHTTNSQLNAGDIAPGQSVTIVLNKKGTWGFHNHRSSGQKGQIIVE